MKIVPRDAEARFRHLLKSFPAVLILGPLQCGKSTFVSECLPDWALFDLERPADLALVQADQEGFFDAHPRRIVIDEAQVTSRLIGGCGGGMSLRRPAEARRYTSSENSSTVKPASRMSFRRVPFATSR
jgi:hypothetical protein